MQGSKLKKMKDRRNNESFKKPSTNAPAELKPIEIRQDEPNELIEEFEDEWEDEIIEENEDEEEDGMITEEGDFVPIGKPKQSNIVPFMGRKEELAPGEVLEHSNSAYKMFHRASTEWPCLSIDFIVDSFDPKNIVKRDFSTGIKEFEYPIDLYAVGGSQADMSHLNSLYVMRFSDLSITQYDDDEYIEKSFEETDPVLYYEKIPVKSATNRVKTLQHYPIVGVMNENGQLQIHDLRDSFANVKARKEGDVLESQGKIKLFKQFMLSNEGYGLDFSPHVLGRIAAGTNDGKLYIVQPRDAEISDLLLMDEQITKHTNSIEDIQFSPTEPDVVASCSSDGTVRIFDLRTPFKNVSELRIDAHNCDVNVISWNKMAPTLLASGADDGSFKVWDLRYTNKPPITNLHWHTEAITSIEWQPHDEWTIAVCSADNRLSMWDFSVEKDDSEMVDENLQNIPDQMMFLHQGQEDLKEVKWHPVYHNVLISTASDGYNVFEPAVDIEDDDSVGSPNDLELVPNQI